MDLSAIFSDDQIGIIGSFLALAACGLVMAVSFRFGPAGQQAGRQAALQPIREQRPTAGRVAPVTVSRTVPARDERRAA